MVRRLSFLVVALGLFSAPLFAQSTSPQHQPVLTESDGVQLMHLLRETSARLDLLQRRQDLVLPPTSGVALIDRAAVIPDPETREPVLTADGWGFACESVDGNLARIAVVVDGVETGATVERVERPDVKQWSDGSGYCWTFGGGWTTSMSGIGVRVPVRLFLLHPTTLAHTVVFRVYDTLNRFADSKPYPFFTPPELR